MAAKAGAIRAGRAFVELFADDSKLVRGLRRAQARLRAFAAFATGIGTKLLLGAAAIALPFALMAREFAKSGDALDKIAARTGVTVELLSAMGFAAEQSGSNINDLERGLGALGRFMVNLKIGSTTSIKVLELLGVTMTDLEKRTPDERIKLLLQQLGKMPDASLRAGVAMNILGRAGRQLLPMAENFDRLTKQAEKFGLIITTKDAKAAAEFTDVMNILKRVFKAVFFQVGAALAPMLVEWAKKIAEMLVQLIAWVRNNKALIVTVVKIIGIVAAAGVGMILLGIAAATLNAIIGLGIVIFQGFAIAVTLAGAAIHFLLSPIGLVLAALGVLLFFIVDWGAVTDTVTDEAGTAWEDFRDRALSAWGGIVDAIAANEIGLAFKIVTLFLKAEWARATANLSNVWADWSTAFKTVWSNAVFATSRILVSGWSGLQSLWHKMLEGWSIAWSTFTGFIQKTWNSTVGFLKKAWNKLKNFVTGKNEGPSPESIDRETERANAAVSRETERKINETVRDTKKRLRDIERQRKGTIAELNDQQKRDDEERFRKQREIFKKNADDLAKARGNLQDAIDLAAKKRRIKEKGKKKPPPEKEIAVGLANAQKTKTAIEGTFSPFDRFAAAGRMDPELALLRKIKDKLDEIGDNTESLNRPEKFRSEFANK